MMSLCCLLSVLRIFLCQYFVKIVVGVSNLSHLQAAILLPCEAIVAQQLSNTIDIINPIIEKLLDHWHDSNQLAGIMWRF